MGCKGSRRCYGWMSHSLSLSLSLSNVIDYEIPACKEVKTSLCPIDYPYLDCTDIAGIYDLVSTKGSSPSLLTISTFLLLLCVGDGLVLASYQVRTMLEHFNMSHFVFEVY